MTTELCDRLRIAHNSNAPVFCLPHISLSDRNVIIDCLVEHPNAVRSLNLGHFRLDDNDGERIARVVATSSTLFSLYIPYNVFTDRTLAALARALWVNTSLRTLYVYDNRVQDTHTVNSLFAEALQNNPRRPEESRWFIHTASRDDLPSLREAATELGHPSLQRLLLART